MLSCRPMEAGLRSSARCVLAALMLATIGASVAVPSGAATQRSDTYEQVPVARNDARPGVSRDYEFAWFRLALLAAGLGVYLVWWRAQRRRSGTAAARASLAVLALLGLTAYASFFYFFRFTHKSGLMAHDSFHYFIGSKYFVELGHFRLYECTLAALDAADAGSQEGIGPVRDLRTLKLIPPRRALQRGRDCRDRFTPERWRSFQRDVTWFHRRIPPGQWQRVLEDHGYHPTPFWTLVGGVLARHTDVASARMWALHRADRVLVAVALLAVTWGFGLRIGALSALLWGTGYLWRYSWMGDAFLRQIWFAALLVGVALLRRGFHVGAGALLAGSALLRIFPAAFLASLGVDGVLRCVRERRVDGRLVRIVAGAAAAALCLFAASLVPAGHGLWMYSEFAEKMGTFVAHDASNRVGLGVALESLGGPPAATRTLQVAVLVAFGWLYLRALSRARPFEAAALGFAWIPLLTNPTNYYFSFVVVGMAVAENRPRVAPLLLVAGIAWGVNGLAQYLEWSEFLGASLIATALSFALTAEVAFGGELESEAADVAPAR